ncbi:hypothetical protein DSO57_1001002 [Entomophthora muscae]|uniref:Uncharacterized protein n=1 Tax=Entomophthora muscae TaxID=34485 RepID=A0ACC2UIW4_9FUNG|nr:hypothetical protein DSO57_1001002 [Entomophthora muscae]
MGWPKAVPYVLVNELCERFGLFGVIALLNQYLKAAFGLKDTEAKTYVHLFNALLYLFPVVGGAISDSYLGKFNTVVVFSVIALVGHLMLSIFSINHCTGEFGKFPIWAFLVPVCLIAIGAGCTKPCAATHAGDQLTEADGPDKFYAAHSLMTSIGILLGVTVLPLIKEHYGYHISYFFVVGVLVVSLVTFVSGKRVFNIVPPSGDFLPWKIAKLVSLAVKRRAKGYKADHWLDLAKEDYSIELIQEARQFLRVAGIFAPLVFAWVLTEQSATEWQNQYEMMDKNYFGITVPTESSSLGGALMIVFLLPFMGFVFFPFLERRGIRVEAGTRIGIGYAFFLASFFFSTFLQYRVHFYAKNRVIVNNVVVSCVGCVSGAWQLPQWILSSLGDAVMGPALGVMVFNNVGVKMRASALSFMLFTAAIANFLIILMEPILACLKSPINRQWCYVSVSSFFFVVYILLLKLWFDPPARRSPGSSKYKA